jgi:SRSO17 transposase
VGKQENCQVAVSVSVSTEEASLPIAWRLYLPEEWAHDSKRRKKAGVPQEIRFQSKPNLALEQIRAAVAREIPTAPVRADPAYGNDTQFREGITELGLFYVVGVMSTMTVWEPGHQPLPPRATRQGRGRPPTRLRRDARHAPVSVKDLALALPAQAWKQVSWRAGTRHKLSSRFAALRVRPAHRDEKRTEVRAEERLLIEWPQGEEAPAKYWLSTLPANTPLRDLVRLAKHRWIIERDYEELKQELGLNHYEGRGWRGLHHHATLCIAAYGFLVAERSRFSPSARAGRLVLPVPEVPPQFRPRGSPGTSPAA